MNLSLTLFVIGFVLIIYGYMNQLNPSCNNRTTTKIVPRHVYDEVLKNSSQSSRQVFDDINSSANSVTSGDTN
jgi:hypothetical protein